MIHTLNNLKLNIFYIIILGILVLFGCKNEKEEMDNSSISPIFSFLKDGHQWEYIYRQNGGEYILNYTSKNIQATDLFKIDITFEGTLIETDTNFMNDKDFGFFVNNQKYTIVKSNGKISDILYNIQNNDTLCYYKLLSTNSSKTVPLGTFKCYLIQEFEYNTDILRTTYYIEKSRGIIYKEDSEGNNWSLSAINF